MTDLFDDFIVPFNVDDLLLQLPTPITYTTGKEFAKDLQLFTDDQLERLLNGIKRTLVLIEAEHHARETSPYRVIMVSWQLVEAHPEQYELPVAAEDIPRVDFLTVASISGDPPLAHPHALSEKPSSAYDGIVVGSPYRIGDPVKIVTQYYHGQSESQKLWVIQRRHTE